MHDHVTDTYFLAEGPLHLAARDKRRKRNILGERVTFTGHCSVFIPILRNTFNVMKNVFPFLLSSRLVILVISLLGSSLSLLVVLVVMCVASLVGTALMDSKKSQDKPSGYTLLDQQYNY